MYSTLWQSLSKLTIGIDVGLEALGMFRIKLKERGRQLSQLML